MRRVSRKKKLNCMKYIEINEMYVFYRNLFMQLVFVLED